MTNHERRTTTNEKKKGTRDASPHVFGQRELTSSSPPSCRPWLSSPSESPPSGPWIARVSRRSIAALSAAWHVAWMSATSRRLTPAVRGRAVLRAKKLGCSIRAPRKVPSEELPLLRGLLLRALGSLLRHCFLLRLCDSASDARAGRHYWWAEPSTLIPDVDYG